MLFRNASYLSEGNFRKTPEVVAVYRKSKIEKVKKVSYDKQTDAASIIFREDTPIAEGDEDKPGVILDYDESGSLISLEILDGSTRVIETHRMEFQTSE